MEEEEEIKLISLEGRWSSFVILYLEGIDTGQSVTEEGRELQANLFNNLHFYQISVLFTFLGKKLLRVRHLHITFYFARLKAALNKENKLISLRSSERFTNEWDWERRKANFIRHNWHLTNLNYSRSRRRKSSCQEPNPPFVNNKFLRSSN